MKNWSFSLLQLGVVTRLLAVLPLVIILWLLTRWAMS